MEARQRAQSIFQEDPQTDPGTTGGCRQSSTPERSEAPEEVSEGAKCRILSPERANLIARAVKKALRNPPTHPRTTRGSAFRKKEAREASSSQF